MIYGSVCSGIEAATAAWHPLGWKPAFFSEIEKFPRQVLQHHYPDVPLFGDFLQIKGDEHGPIELLVGGTPCQSFSVAGLRKGMADPRGNLALGFLGLVERTRPRWVVWENVPGVLSSTGGRDFGSFLGALGKLGYGWSYRILDAQYFGVAQRRRRVFVVAYLGDWRPAAAVLFERQSLCRDTPPRREAGKDVADRSGYGVEGGSTYRWQNDSAGIVSDEISATLRRESSTTDERSVPAYAIHAWPAEVAPTLNAHFGEKQGLENQHIQGGGGLFVPSQMPHREQPTNKCGNRDSDSVSRGFL